jgi:hypothetical protein
VNGNVLLRKKAGSDDETIDISSLSRGIYLLKVYDSEYTRICKFVKQ